MQRKEDLSYNKTILHRGARTGGGEGAPFAGVMQKIWNTVHIFVVYKLSAGVTETSHKPNPYTSFKTYMYVKLTFSS